VAKQHLKVAYTCTKCGKNFLGHQNCSVQSTDVVVIGLLRYSWHSD